MTASSRAVAAVCAMQLAVCSARAGPDASGVPSRTLSVIFIQCDIRQDEVDSILDPLRELFGLLLATQAHGSTNALMVYPLCSETDESQSLASCDFGAYSRRIGHEAPYRQERIARSLRDSLAARCRDVLFARLAGQPHGNDILNSYRVLVGLHDRICQFDSVRVFYLSSMIQIDDEHIPDSRRGIYNFADRYSFERFRDNVTRGVQYQEIRLQPVLCRVPGQDLVVYIVSIPTRVRVPAVVAHQLHDVWKAYFRQIGARETAFLDLFGLGRALGR